LSVIEAEVDLALSRPRDGAAYVAVLGRIGAEGRRLRRIVDDLLWLARTDATRGAIGERAPVDIAVIAAACTERFLALGERRGLTISFTREGNDRFMVLARPEDIDRLTGVLVDNACKHAGDGGRVEVRVRASGGRVGLEVNDSGVGIPEDQVPLIFDRFHRATDAAGGTGLGLAIADAIVRSTRGSWSVGRSGLGGAHLAVSWRRASRHPLMTPSARRLGVKRLSGRSRRSRPGHDDDPEDAENASKGHIRSS
jgi:signal transduction histidine kinase